MKDRKIDLVYLWVDSNDSEWRAEKERWFLKIRGKSETYAAANTAARWRDNDELRYSLRSAEKFAPWINHIYIITGFGQVPKWLDTNNPKITIVPHESIIPADVLPTFNSSTIEMCITNIPNLSEYFLLANDDTFFNQPLKPDFFFDKNGRAIVWYSKHPTVNRNFEQWLHSMDGYHQTLAWTNKLIYDVFGRDYMKLKPGHNIDPYIKSSIITVLNHPDIAPKINAQIKNKFRTTQEIQRWIFNLYDHIHGRAILRRARRFKRTKYKLYNTLYNFVHYFECKNSPIFCTDAKKEKLLKIAPPLFCINDSDDNTDETRENNKKFLETRFPEKSSFEI